uniref:Uncharacterized protein n=1 Tax=Pyxicephalus adspersus TaxID=30357 RepID=A0AAV2ZVA8_PYXAD|nr:TPA: hypothetical protein GDO54_015273 [Pyxicephalus adspersus]
MCALTQTLMLQCLVPDHRHNYTRGSREQGGVPNQHFANTNLQLIDIFLWAELGRWLSCWLSESQPSDGVAGRWWQPLTRPL